MKDERTEGEAGLARVAYIRLPKEFSREIGGITLDPEIPLPVERPEGAPEGQVPLSLEAILAGMLKVLAWAPADPNRDYYRRFIIAARPSLPAELASTGIDQARSGSFAVAREIFLALSGLDPRNPVHQANLAALHDDRSDALRRTGEEEDAEAEALEAAAAWKRALSMENPPPGVFWGAALSAMKRRDYERARDLFAAYLPVSDDEEKAARAKELIQKIESQGYLDTMFKEAFDFIQMGKEEEGLARIQTFLSSYDFVWNAWFLKGWALRRLGRWEEGREAFERALTLIEEAADRVDSLNELSICLLELGRTADARKRLSEALAIEPENVKIIANLGMLSLKEGKPEEARRFFMAALEIDPDDPLAADCLAKLEKEGN